MTELLCVKLFGFELAAHWEHQMWADGKLFWHEKRPGERVWCIGRLTLYVSRVR